MTAATDKRKRKKGAGSPRSMLPLKEMEAAAWLARGSAGAVGWYLVGSVPFWTALVLFWGDMRFSHAARESCILFSLFLSLTFVWMKACQAGYTTHLRRLLGDEVPAWTPATIFHMVCRQAVLQASGIIILPLAAVVALPFGWCYAFYQNLTAREQPDQTLRRLVRESWELAKLAPKENHLAIWLASPAMIWAVAIVAGALGAGSSMVDSTVLGGIGWLYMMIAILVALMAPVPLLVAANIAAFLMALPYLLRICLGIETMMTMAPGRVMTSPTFLLIVTCVTYFLLDPIMKSFYVLRCFAGASRTSGADLKLRWRKVFTVALLVLLVQTSYGNTSQSEFDRSVDQILSEREFAWRMPRDPLEIDDELAGDLLGPYEQFLESLRELYEKFMRWLEKFRPEPRAANSGKEGIAWESTVTRLLLFVVTALLIYLTIMMIRAWRRRIPEIETEAEPVVVAPDLADENVDAGALPESAWMTMAREMADGGDHRLAIRALFLASIAHLSDRHLVHVARFKSNADYERELTRRGHALPELLQNFQDGRRSFETIWYGTTEATEERYRQFRETTEEILSDA